MMENEYKIIELIGKGTSGEVFSALNADGEVVAIKIYKNESDANMAKYEFNMANAVNSENILKPIAFQYIEGKPAIVLPYCKRRSADGMAGYYDEKTIWRLMRDVASALSCLHNGNFGHFDVKPSNIMIGDERFLLSDFGSCRSLDDKLNNRDDASATDCSSFRFNAPERCFRKENDIWSFGATVFYLFMGCYVFSGLGGRAQKRTSVIPLMRMRMPQLNDVVKRCLAFDPSARPTAEELLQISEKQYDLCCHTMPNRCLKHEKERLTVAVPANEAWPEEMS